MAHALTEDLGNIIAELKKEVSRVVQIRTNELAELLEMERALKVVGGSSKVATRRIGKKPGPKAKKEGARRGRKRSENSVASRVLALINAGTPAATWQPDDVRVELGGNEDIRVVTTTLATLAREGLIERPSRGVYKRAGRAAARAA